FHVLVDANAVCRSDLRAQVLRLPEDPVEQQRVLFDGATLRAGSPEQPLIDGLWIDLASQRSGRAAPGDMRAVNTGVPHVAVDTCGLRLNAQLNRWQSGLFAEALGRHLVHRDAMNVDVNTQRLADRGAGDDAGLFHVVSVTGIGGGVPGVAHHDDLV